MQQKQWKVETNIGNKKRKQTQSAAIICKSQRNEIKKPPNENEN